MTKDLHASYTEGLLMSTVLKHSALDQVHCFVSLLPEPRTLKTGWAVDYTVGITVTLHKTTDPRAEFEAQRRVTALGVVPEDSVKTVPGLGDKAYLVTQGLGSTELRVVEGGAVLSLSLSGVPRYMDEGEDDVIGEGPATPDLSPYQSAMVSDMRDLMASLKR
ncbi:hypothetical protein [Streptomyces sp. NPDC002265]|uniref:hypothetical protein n=1 Tax=Streptomyces sp. NPDC002265 TaxID=3154415 RepID=UPI003316883B